uniref:Uncharacterized protein n=1 Tax=Rhodococcus sp. NS1 TaxID=402236 RepID=A0A097SQ36_9NOCA|nr:hypothetical protein LRS1606.200 [Rhodococcus sp. NS1]
MCGLDGRRRRCSGWFLSSACSVRGSRCCEGVGEVAGVAPHVPMLLGAEFACGGGLRDHWIQAVPVRSRRHRDRDLRPGVPRAMPWGDSASRPCAVRCTVWSCFRVTTRAHRTGTCSAGRSSLSSMAFCGL